MGFVGKIRKYFAKTVWVFILAWFTNNYIDCILNQKSITFLFSSLSLLYNYLSILKRSKSFVAILMLFLDLFIKQLHPTYFVNIK